MNNAQKPMNDRMLDRVEQIRTHARLIFKIAMREGREPTPMEMREIERDSARILKIMAIVESGLRFGTFLLFVNQAIGAEKARWLEGAELEFLVEEMWNGISAESAGAGFRDVFECRDHLEPDPDAAVIAQLREDQRPFQVRDN